MREPTDLLARAAALRRGRLTPEQEAARKAVDERNERLQKLALRPLDGVTFARSKPPPKAA